MFNQRKTAIITFHKHTRFILLALIGAVMKSTAIYIYSYLHVTRIFINEYVTLPFSFSIHILISYIFLRRTAIVNRSAFSWKLKL